MKEVKVDRRLQVLALLRGEPPHGTDSLVAILVWDRALEALLRSLSFVLQDFKQPVSRKVWVAVEGKS